MIAKGNRHNNGAKLARYMMTGNFEKDERAELYQLRGFASGHVLDAFRDVEVMAEATKAENALFHVQVRLPEHERLTPEQWEHAADRIEIKLGLNGQPRAICFHVNEQTAERHMHVGWSLIDEEEMKAKPVPFFKFRLKDISRELEKEFDLTPVKNERDGPVKYAAKKNEQQQAQRLGTDKDEIRNTIRACWDRSDCGQSFQAALEHEGLTLTQGDRRGLVVVDHAGGLHALGKRILDVNKSQMLARLADLDLTELPHVNQARALIRELAPEQGPEKKQPTWNRDRANERWEDAVITAAIEQEKHDRRFVDPKPQRETHAGGREKDGKGWAETTNVPTDAFKEAGLEMAGSTSPEKPLKGIEKQLWGAYRSGPNANDLAAALDDRGIAFACVTHDEAYKSYREAQFAKAVGRIAPVYGEGEIVVVRSPGPEYLRQGEWTELNRVQKLEAHAEKYLEVLGLDRSKLKGIEATKAMLDISAKDRATYWQDIRLERATTINPFAPEQSAEILATFGKTGGRAIGAALNLGEKLLEGLISILDPPTTPFQRQEAAENARHGREADVERSIDFSKYTADRAQERTNHQEQQAARDRQREQERDR